MASSTNKLPETIASPTTVHKQVDDLDHIMAMANFTPDDNVFLIDVRGREERAKDGCVPHSHNLPLDEIEMALQLPEDEFKAKYGYTKPQKSAYIVFSCWSGLRAQKALDMFMNAGYTHVKFSSGSYKQYYEAKKEEEVKK